MCTIQIGQSQENLHQIAGENIRLLKLAEKLLGENIRLLAELECERKKTAMYMRMAKVEKQSAIASLKRGMRPEDPSPCCNLDCPKHDAVNHPDSGCSEKSIHGVDCCPGWMPIYCQCETCARIRFSLSPGEGDGRQDNC